MSVRNLAEYLNDRVGDYHRGTVRYEKEAIEIIYLREDIRERRLESDVEMMLKRLRPESKEAEEQAFRFGELRATMRSFEQAIIIHFPRGDSRGVVVALEPDIGRNFNDFLRECLQQLD